MGWDGGVPEVDAAPAPEVTASRPEAATRSWKRSRTARTTVAIAAVVVLLAGGAVGAAVVSTSNQAAATRAAALKHKRELAAEQAAQQAAAKQAERDSRQALMTALEQSVKKTAKEDVQKGVLTGSIIDVSCTPLGGGSTDDLTQKSSTMQCFAANQKNDDGTENGYNFSATINWTTGEYTWAPGHLGTWAADETRGSRQGGDRVASRRNIRLGYRRRRSWGR